MGGLINFLEFFIQFGSGLAFFWFFIEVFRKKAGEPLNVMAYIGLLLGFIMFRQADLVGYTSIENPDELSFLLSAFMCLGPAVFLQIRKMTSFANDQRSRPIWGHFIPAIIFALLEVYAYLSSFNPLTYSFMKLGETSQLDIFYIGIIISVVSLNFYFFKAFFIVHRLFDRFDLPYARTARITFIMPLVSINIGAVGFYFAFTLIMLIGFSMQTLAIMLVYGVSIRHPFFFSDLAKDIKQAKYETTVLNDVDIPRIKQMLVDLMENKKLYLDENLRLTTVAAEMNITRQKLSRILNELFGKNFNEFINEYRVKEAKGKLIDEKEKTVLLIGYESGFNSKSTFNRQFTNLTGQSPENLRRKFSGDKD